MSALEHTSSIERSLKAHPPTDSQFPGIILFMLAVAVSVAGVVLEKYYLIATLPAVWLLIRYPVESTLGLFALLIPFDSVLTIGRTGYTLNWILGAVAGAVVLAYGLLSNRLTTPPRVALLWVLFILWAAETLFWALDPKQGLQRLPTAMCLVLLYLVVVSFRIDQREFKTVILLAIVGGALASAYTLREFTQGQGWLSRASLIANGQATNPNDFADTLLLPLSLALGGFLSAKTLLRRSGMLAAAVLMAFCLLLTMSRGSLIAVAAILFVYLGRLRVRARVLVPVVLICVLVTFLPTLFFIRMQESIASRAEGRWDLFIVGTQVIRHYGILGIGLDNFRVAYTKFAGFAPVFRGFDRDPHNIYLQVWAELGIIGLVLFLAAISSQLAGLHAAYRERKGSPNHLLLAIEAACWAMLVHGFSANLLWRKEFWLVFMLAALMLQLRHYSEATEPQQVPLAQDWHPRPRNLAP